MLNTTKRVLHSPTLPNDSQKENLIIAVYRIQKLLKHIIYDALLHPTQMEILLDLKVYLYLINFKSLLFYASQLKIAENLVFFHLSFFLMHFSFFKMKFFKNIQIQRYFSVTLQLCWITHIILLYSLCKSIIYCNIHTGLACSVKAWGNSSSWWW